MIVLLYRLVAGQNHARECSTSVGATRPAARFRNSAQASGSNSAGAGRGGFERARRTFCRV
jgi:hypothetical protein